MSKLEKIDAAAKAASKVRRKKPATAAKKLVVALKVELAKAKTAPAQLVYVATWH